MLNYNKSSSWAPNSDQSEPRTVESRLFNVQQSLSLPVDQRWGVALNNNSPNYAGPDRPAYQTIAVVLGGCG